jgi:site-specific DNA recombinase
MQELSNDNLRLALYCRVSTEEQREGQTIDSQVSELEQFASGRNWTVFRVYKDEGWSGSMLARPALDQLRDDASKHLFNAVLINDVDRLARDVSHLGIIKRDLERYGVQVVFKKLPGQSSPTHNLLINVLGSFAEFERELIADRTRRGKRYKVETRKQYLGAIPPYGFQYISKAKADSGEAGLRVLPQEAEVVRQIYCWVAEERLSVKRVVEKLNRSAILPRKAGSAWQKSSVLRILHSEVYIGKWHYNKHQHCEPRRRRSGNKYRKTLKSSIRLRPRTEWIEVLLPDSLRIIEPAQWREVQQQLQRNRVFSPRHSIHRYLLTGLIRCGGCQASYVGEPSHGRFSYRCHRRCGQYPSIREAFLNVVVWNAFRQAMQKPHIILRALKQHPNSESPADPQTPSATALLKIDAEEARIIEAYRLEVLSPEQLARELQMLKVRKAFLQSNAKATNELKAGSGNVERSVKEYCRIVARRITKLNWEERQQLLQLLLKSVVFKGDHITIAGHIPNVPSVSGTRGGIESTMSTDYDRNTTPIPFELICPIKRPKEVTDPSPTGLPI